MPPGRLVSPPARSLLPRKAGARFLQFQPDLAHEVFAHLGPTFRQVMHDLSRARVHPQSAKSIPDRLTFPGPEGYPPSHRSISLGSLPTLMCRECW